MSFFATRLRNQTSNTVESELNEVQSQGTLTKSDEQNQFIEAIRRNDLDSVKEFLDDRPVNINSIDRAGRTALQIAVQGQNISMLTGLLERGAYIGNALLDAIKIGSMECVTILVQYDKVRKQSLGHSKRRESQEMSRSQQTSLRNKVLTPLVLASQMENFEITRFLMLHGYTIEKPHPQFCTCSSCEALGRLGRYLNNLNIYRALVSPVFLTLTFLLQDPRDTSGKLDPIYKAFVLKREILNLADVEFEFREDYLELAEKCEDFAVSLLDQCSDLEEISLFMTMPALKGDSVVRVIGGSRQQKMLSTLNFAIKYENTNFIAHRYSQVLLNAVVYDGLKGMEQRNMFINSLAIFVYWIFLPVVMLIYQFLPTISWTRLLEVPMVKYLSHLGSTVWFLCILIAASFQDKLPNSEALKISVIDMLVGLWVIGIMVEEIKQARRQGKERYKSQWWHLTTVAVVFLFILTAILWLIGFISLAKKQDTLSVSLRYIRFDKYIAPRTAILLSHSYYASALVLTFFQASYHFQVSYIFGPLNLSMNRMVVDVVKFFVLFCYSYFAFCIGLRKLYSEYVQTLKSISNETSTNDTTHIFERAEETFSYLFWALFGLGELNDQFNTKKGFEITQISGNLMFGFYLITALVALNVLIAMLTNTFQKVSQQQDVIFKVARSRILMQYVNKGSVSPAPFNLLPFKAAVRYMYSLCKTCATQNFKESTLRYNEERRNRVMRLLIQRYFMEKDDEEICSETFAAVEDQQSTNQNSSL